ncbi:MAG: ATP-dependent Clp protease adapter ClpS [Mariprofundaceae bacterium]
MSEVATPDTIQIPKVKPDKPKLKRPPMYKVILLNDDFTPMDFVVDILCLHFHKSTEDAMQIMLRVHHHGKAVCGVYPHGIAESKVALVENCSRQEGHPLRCVMEHDEHD